ncbi:hypothetical protein PV325_002130 [Microctonus aethiopoides]|nr:hypothetical protein PV325_002130 [Microctonus aethiopoides]
MNCGWAASRRRQTNIASSGLQVLLGSRVKVEWRMLGEAIMTLETSDISISSTLRTQTVQLRYSKETKDLIATIALENSRGNSLDTDDVGIHSSEGGPTDLSYFTSLASSIVLCRRHARGRTEMNRASGPGVLYKYVTRKQTGNPLSLALRFPIAVPLPAKTIRRGQQRRRRRRGRATSPNKCTGNPPVYTSDRNFPNDAVISTTLEPTFVEEIGNTTVPAGRSIKLACSVKDLGTYKEKSGHRKTVRKCKFLRCERRAFVKQGIRETTRPQTCGLAQPNLRPKRTLG